MRLAGRRGPADSHVRVAYQANYFRVRVRLGADGVLREVGDVFSKKGWPCFPPAR